MKRLTQTTLVGALMFAAGMLVAWNRTAVGQSDCSTSTPIVAGGTATVTGPATASAGMGTQDNPVPLGTSAKVTIEDLSDTYVYDIAITKLHLGRQ
jgi:hypothetical protein